MRSRINITQVLIAAIIGGVLIFSPPLRAADPTPIACPNGQTVFLEGQAAPSEALLIYLRGRAVGGGLSGFDGRYRLPLRPQERPGIYPVEVRLRVTRAIIASFTCYIDVPLADVPAPTEAGPPTAALPPTTRAQTPIPPTAIRPTTAATTAATTVATARTTTAGTTVTTGTTTAGTTVTTGTTTTVTTTATVTTTTTVTPSTPTISPTLELNDIVLRDPAFPDISEEYVQIRNVTEDPVTLTGWRIVNASRPEVPAYVFPAFTLAGDLTISVFTAVGDDDLINGDFYWDQATDVWRVGDRAELRDPQGRLVSFLIVPNQSE